LTLVKNPDFYEKGLPYLDTLTYEIIPSDIIRLGRFENGQLDYVDNTSLPAARFESIINDPKWNKLGGEKIREIPEIEDLSQSLIMKKPALVTEYLGMDVKSDLFSDKRVRKAFNHSVDKQKIVDRVYNGKRGIAMGVLPPGFPGFNEANKVPYPYDPDKARELFAQAGWKDTDNDGFLDKDGKNFTVTLWHNQREILASLCTSVQADLRDVGIDVDVRSLQWASYIEKVRKNEAIFFRFGWSADFPDPDNFLWTLFSSQNVGQDNTTRYSNPVVDKMLDEARSITDWSKREKLYHEAEKIIIDGDSLTLKQIELVCNFNYQVEISESVIDRVNKSRQVIENIIADKKVVYGVNTGFGYLKNTVVSNEDIELLQENLIVSHAAGVGDYFDKNVSKAMLLLRANALLKGFSGIRLKVIQRLLDLLNLDITPLVPSQGSVGASGDLAPLSHLVLPIMGKGKVFYKDKQYDSLEVLKLNNLEPISLEAKEGLALINGTQAIAAVGAINLIKVKRIIDLADAISATSLEALKGTKEAFRNELHVIRPHLGQIQTAKNMTKMLNNSELMDSHKGCDQVQDAYSLRCIPQVHGSVRDTVNYVEKVLSTEFNSVTDNPIVLTETNEVISCGNFHGEPLALVMVYQHF
ncbi:hypothetical protein EON78_01910, partial [bacterium]